MADSGLRDYAEQWTTGTGVLIPPQRQSPPEPRQESRSGAGEGPVGQGTRASIAQGTLNGPKPPPQATAFGDAGTKPNTDGKPRWWPSNIARAIFSPSGSRTEQLRTDYEQQVQPAPGRIIRQMFARNQGLIGDDLIASFPYNGEWSLIPHQEIPRKPMGVGPMPRQSDDNAPIPAIYAGNPRPTR